MILVTACVWMLLSSAAGFARLNYPRSNFVRHMTAAKQVTITQPMSDFDIGEKNYAKITVKLRNQKDLDRLLSVYGTIVKDSQLILNYDEVIDGDQFMVDGTMSKRLSDLENARRNDDRIRELKGVLSVCNLKEIPTIQKLIEVYDGVLLQRKDVGFKTPDLYGYGILTNGEPFEMVGDFKKMAKKNLESIMKQLMVYKEMLVDTTTSVVGKYFKSPRIPTKNIIVVLITAYIDQYAIDECGKHAILLFGPKEECEIVPDGWPKKFHLLNYGN